MAIARVHLDEPLAAGAVAALDADRAHYLQRVLRLGAGAELLLFNARDGEWRARIHGVGRRTVSVELVERIRRPAPEPGPTLVFAPLRPNRMDWLVEKAVELGAAALVPVITRRTVVRIERAQRLQAIAVEAAEQAGRLHVPKIAEPLPLAAWLDRRETGARLLVADPDPGAGSFLDAQRGAEPAQILIGPEGGLEETERAAALAGGGVAVSLGPRVLRAETAALAALAAWQVAADTARIR